MTKEPWEMTLKEYKKALVKPTDRVAWGNHYQYVKNALEEGKPVPAEVLKDYPELASIAPATIYGWLSPPLMEELKRLVELEEWPPPEEPTPTFSTVLQVCDYAFTLKVLKWKCDEMDVGKSGHKKIIIARLLNAEEEELTDIAQRTIAEMEDRGLFEEEEISLEEVTEIARKVVGR